MFFMPKSMREEENGVKVNVPAVSTLAELKLIWAFAKVCSSMGV